MWSGMSAPSVMALLRSNSSNFQSNSHFGAPQEGEVDRMPLEPTQTGIPATPHPPDASSARGAVP